MGRGRGAGKLTKGKESWEVYLLREVITNEQQVMASNRGQMRNKAEHKVSVSGKK